MKCTIENFLAVSALALGLSGPLSAVGLAATQAFKPASAISQPAADAPETHATV